ncbi:MAG TPA: ATP-binding protein [Burkholderiaceae bacterium]|nr:ATP-binding protein [Burkholderiaceae bacterium]
MSLREELWPRAGGDARAPARAGRSVGPWSTAVLAALGAFALRLVAQPMLGDGLPFVFALPAVTLVALAVGFGPGLLTTALSALALLLPLAPAIAPTERPAQVGAFMLSALVICLACSQFGRRRTTDAARAEPRTDTPLTAWLRTVLWGALLIPMLAFGIVAWWGYERALRQGEAEVVHASAVVLAQAQRTFEVAARLAHLADAAAPGSDAQVREAEAQAHQRLSDLVAGVPAVVNLNIWDAKGRPLVRSDVFPVNPAASVADRQYFIDQRDRPQPLGISEVIIGRQSGAELLNATIRRAPAEGPFNGLVAVSLSPAYFRDYYRSLATEQPTLASFALVRTDGALLARWPPSPDGRTRVEPGRSVLGRVLAGEMQGVAVIEANSGREERLVGFRRVPGLPLYVAAGVGTRAMMAEWLRFVAVLAAVLVPTTLGLVYVSWVALKRTRREQAVSAELREQIARRAKAEQTALETQKFEALAQLTGGVAHDFNNLLTIVSTSLHVHRRRHPEMGQERQLESMARAVASGVRLTRQLLSFSRKQALRPETVLLQRWLPAAEGLVRSPLGAGVTLAFDVAPDTAPITVDLAELELALINAALNAQHAMPAGGTLRVAAHNSSDADGGRAMVVISVADTGVGIPPELVPKVFEPFFTTKGPGKGSGLGLSQVHGLCAQAGGFATLASEVGRGTTLSMHFPAAAHAASVVLPDEAVADGPLAGHVLLVEDNDEVAAATEGLLRGAGLEVTRTASADAALAALAAAPRVHDVVLSDISMPGSMDGIGLAFAMRERRPPLPVLLTTGYAERIDESIRAGFRVLTKPVPPEALLREIGVALAERRAALAPG